jgi:hypothetical protein
MLLVAVVVAVVFRYKTASSKPLTDRDTIVLADFTNSTGDPVFDETLKQGLSSQLEQSPFLNLLSGERVAQTLSLMTKPKETRLTNELTMDVCKRTGSAAIVQGSIATLGRQYVLGLKAVACGNGDTLADVQVTADGKEQVLSALGQAADQMRGRLGESLASLQKYNVPARQVTTASLEALNAYSLGVKAQNESGAMAAVPFFRQAVQIDPDFAMGYLGLGVALSNAYEFRQAGLNLEKAFALRDRVSRREYFSISSQYYDTVTEDLQKSIEVYKLWMQTYPQDMTPFDHLGNDYLLVGQYKQALEVLSEEKRLAGTGTYNFVNLVDAYLSLDRFQDAKATIEDAGTRKLPQSEIHSLLYITDFAEQKYAEMEAEAAWAESHPDVQAEFYVAESDTQAYGGHAKKAWALTDKAVAAAQRETGREAAAVYLVNGALHEAEFGNSVRAEGATISALNLAPTRGVKTLAALALARAGLTDRASSLADELTQAHPSDTLLNNYWLPSIRASVELNLNRPGQAIETLKAAEAFELGSPPTIGPAPLYPAYIRGLAYFRLGQGGQAAGEFQKLVAHPGCLLNYMLGPLARLQLGRASALAGDKAAARAAYQDFFTLWKDADPDIPCLKQAKAEYAKLQ